MNNFNFGQIIDNISNIEGLDNTTILKTLKEFEQYIKDNAVQGPQGAQGPQGPQGVQGPQGPQGEGFSYKGTWASGNDYVKDDVVSYDNDGTTNTYILITNALVGSTTPPSEDAVNWKIFVSGGGSASGGIQSTTIASADLKTSLSNLVKAGHTIISLEFEDKTGNITIPQQTLTLNTDGSITASSYSFNMPKSLIFTPTNIVHNIPLDVYYVNMASAYGPDVYTLVMSPSASGFSAPLSIAQVGATSFRIGGQSIPSPNNLGSNNFIVKYI